MKKVSLLAALAIVGGTAAVAQSATPPSPSCPKAFQGFHIGGNLGYDAGYGNQKFSTDIDTDSGSAITSGKNKLGVNGVDGGIGFGYTHRLGNWGLGLAFDANWANTRGKHSRAADFTVRGDDPDDDVSGEIVESAKVRLRNSLQLYARAGYVIGGMAMPFVGLGWDNSAWKQSFSHSNTVTGVDESMSKSKRFNALLWKLGVDFLATKHLVVGFEYTGTQAGCKKMTRTNAEGDTFKSKFRPQNNKFALTAKLVY